MLETSVPSAPAPPPETGAADASAAAVASAAHAGPTASAATKAAQETVAANAPRALRLERVLNVQCIFLIPQSRAANERTRCSGLVGGADVGASGNAFVMLLCSSCDRPNAGAGGAPRVLSKSGLKPRMWVARDALGPCAPLLPALGDRP